VDATFLTLGANAPDAALTLNRVALGVFFAISGYHKLFNASRHATLARTLQADGVPAVSVMEWVVPSVEFGGGLALIVGLLSALAAFGLFVICLGALTLDALRRVSSWAPIDRADLVGDLLYLPESLYCIALAVVMLAGPGPWSLDAAWAWRLTTL
jgi:putative oxidoreductase